MTHVEFSPRDQTCIVYSINGSHGQDLGSAHDQRQEEFPMWTENMKEAWTRVSETETESI